MATPESPPDAVSTLANLTRNQVLALLKECGSTVASGQYLHWDKFRRVPPPPHWTIQEWWSATHLVRRGQWMATGFFDSAGKPFVFQAPPAVQEELHWWDRNASGEKFWQEAGVPDLQPRQTLAIHTRTLEAIFSSRLAGAPLPLRQGRALIREGGGPRTLNERICLNHWKALNALARLGGKPLNPPNLFELHRILTQSTLDPPEMAGRLRTDPDPRPILDPGDGSILHLPPGPQSLPKRLMTLGRFANMGSSQPFIHPLIQAIILHFMVAYDHPFVDGNGRLARILFYWHMAKHGYKIMDAVSISEILAEGPEPYRQAFLETQTDHNDLTHFILHQLAVLKRSLARTRNLGAIQMRETRTTAARLKQKGDRGKFLNFRQLALMGHALDHPGHIYDIHQHRQTHGLAYDTARKDLLLLSDARRWLIRKKAGKAFVFIAPQDLEAKLSSSK